MPPSAKMLRMIEDVCAEDDSKLQKGFDDYNKCTGISNLHIIIFSALCNTLTFNIVQLMLMHIKIHLQEKRMNATQPLKFISVVEMPIFRLRM
jgi:hypothetical protein